MVHGYLYTIGYDQRERPLAHLELAALAGLVPPGPVGWPAEGPVLLPQPAPVERSAYTMARIGILAQAPTLDGLCQAVAALPQRFDRFRLQTLGVDGSLGVIRRVADHLPGRPDLDEPAVELVVARVAQGWFFGRLEERGGAGWRRHVDKPQQFSSALSPRMARALVNLVAGPGDRLVDPCCGAGTVLLEACSLGVAAVGFDINPKLVWAARRNLAHYGYPAHVQQADARTLQAGPFDAAVLDLPYGRNLQGGRELTASIAANLRQLAQRLAVAAADDIATLLAETGWAVLASATVPKGSLTRHIYLCAHRR